MLNYTFLTKMKFQKLNFEDCYLITPKPKEILEILQEYFVNYK